jgi:hypothetical protein
LLVMWGHFSAARQNLGDAARTTPLNSKFKLKVGRVRTKRSASSLCL